MKRFQKILVATDTRFDSHPIVDEAVEIARQNGASLKIVDVVPDFPWTIRLTMNDHQHVHELMCEEKQEKLDALVARNRGRGIEIESKVLRGKTSVEIIREALHEQHDLVMRVAKGEDSRREGFFGNSGIRLLRQCPCAVWLVAPMEVTQFRHVVGCVDTSSGDQRDKQLNDEIYELSQSISQYHQGRFSIVHAWAIWGNQLLKGRMSSEDFEEMQTDREREAVASFGKFLKQHESDADDDNVHLIAGEPASAIPKFIRDNNVDLVVMGTIARSGLSGMIMGNTAEQVLLGISCSVLALKPTGFVSSVRLDS